MPPSFQTVSDNGVKFTVCFFADSSPVYPSAKDLQEDIDVFSALRSEEAKKPEYNDMHKRIYKYLTLFCEAWGITVVHTPEDIPSHAVCDDIVSFCLALDLPVYE